MINIPGTTKTLSVRGSHNDLIHASDRGQGKKEKLNGLLLTLSSSGDLARQKTLVLAPPASNSLAWVYDDDDGCRGTIAGCKQYSNGDGGGKRQGKHTLAFYTDLPSRFFRAFIHSPILNK